MDFDRKVRIVLGLSDVHDAETVRDLLLPMYDVEIVEDSEDAYHTIHVFKPDLAILDFSLDKIHPIELYEGMSFAHANVNFVMCVTEDNFQVAQRIWKQRSVDFIFKPFYPQQCVNNINTIVRNFLNMVEIEQLQNKVRELEDELKRLR